MEMCQDLLGNIVKVIEDFYSCRGICIKHFFFILQSGQNLRNLITRSLKELWNNMMSQKPLNHTSKQKSVKDSSFHNWTLKTLIVMMNCLLCQFLKIHSKKLAQQAVLTPYPTANLKPTSIKIFFCSLAISSGKKKRFAD